MEKSSICYSGDSKELSVRSLAEKQQTSNLYYAGSIPAGRTTYKGVFSKQKLLVRIQFAPPMGQIAGMVSRTHPVTLKERR